MPLRKVQRRPRPESIKFQSQLPGSMGANRPGGLQGGNAAAFTCSTSGRHPLAAASEQKGLGIHGPDAHSNSHAMALLVPNLQIPFQVEHRVSMRHLAANAAMLDGCAWKFRPRPLSKLREYRLLITIDDIAEVKFAEAWADRLFEVLEYRNSTRRFISCTGQITAGRDVDSGTGQAIERQLCQHHAIYEAGINFRGCRIN